MSHLPPANFTKSALRKQALDQRKQLPIKEISEAICWQIKGLNGFKSARRVFFYYPVKNELDLRPLVAQCPDKEWLLPVVPPGQAMHFVPCGDIDKLQPGAYGIAEPQAPENSDARVFPPDICAEDCLILPGLLFDRAGYRLGYGKGYFDRFLAATQQAGKQPVLVGAVPAALLMDTLPRDSWDQPAQWVITEREVLSIPPLSAE